MGRVSARPTGNRGLLFFHVLPLPHASRLRLPGLLLLAIVASFYLVDLDRTPVYLGGDEAQFAVQAHSLAQTGRNLQGDLFPLFVRLSDPIGPALPPWGETWYQPFLFYLLAVVLKFLPLSEAVVRLPVAILAGIVNPLLMYLVARRIFGNRAYAGLAALLLVLSPAHLILGRQALDYICPLPFVLGWMWCVLVFIETGRERFAFAAGLVLGVGCYSYLASWMMMPIYLASSWLVFQQSGRAWVRPAALATTGFAVPLAILGPWLWTHPQVLHDTVARYSTGAPINLATIRSWISIYWSYFDPGFLFLTGGPSMTTSTGRAGVFLLPMAVLMPVGLYAILRVRDRLHMRGVILAGLLSAPIAATLKGEAGMVQREMVLLPFAVLLAVYGYAWLRRSRHRLAPALTTALLVVVPLQFGVFASDYWGHYKRRSAFYYDSSAFRSVADAIVAADAPAASEIFLCSQLDDVTVRWRFYTTKTGRLAMLNRTHYFYWDGGDINVPVGSLVVMPADNGAIARLNRAGQWTVLPSILDVDGRPAAAILRRVS